jgi:hypothetical protein
MKSRQQMNMEEIHIRVQQLERSNKRLRGFTTVAILLCGVILLMATTAPQDVPLVIKAQQFVLQDAAGHERASLFTKDNAWGLVLYNGDSTKGAAIIVSEHGNSVLLNDSKEKSGMAMFAKDEESTLGMYDTTGKTRIELKNNSARLLLRLSR